jgi:hypothetical protein
MIEGPSLGNDLLVVDFKARRYREGKATLSRDVAAILDRLGLWRVPNLGGCLASQGGAATRRECRLSFVTCHLSLDPRWPTTGTLEAIPTRQRSARSDGAARKVCRP